MPALFCDASDITEASPPTEVADSMVHGLKWIAPPGTRFE